MTDSESIRQLRVSKLGKITRLVITAAFAILTISVCCSKTVNTEAFSNKEIKNQGFAIANIYTVQLLENSEQSTKNMLSSLKSKEIIRYINTLTDTVEKLKYRNEEFEEMLAEQIDHVLKSMIRFEETDESTFEEINSIMDRMLEYDQQKTEEAEATKQNTADFSRWAIATFSIWDGLECQELIDRGYLCNFAGIWLHHAGGAFSTQFFRIKDGNAVILNGNAYTGKWITGGYVSPQTGSYHFSDGSQMPYGADRYMIICQNGAIQSPDGWPIWIAYFE